MLPRRTTKVAGVALAALAVLGVAGCVPAAEPTTTPPPAEPDSALLAVSALLDEDGAIPLDAAQRIFAATVEPIAGVEPLDLGSEAPADLAGAAIRRMAAALDELPPAVAARLTDLLEPAAGDREVVLEPDGRPRGEGETGTVPAEVPSADELDVLVRDIVAELERRSGHDLRIPLLVRTTSSERLRSLGVASGVYGGGGDTTGCRVALGDGLFGLDEASITSTVVHEVWHCFQLDVSPSAFEDGPMWVIEGQAEYAGEAYIGGSPSSADNWNTWLLTPDQRLPGRSYDAIGLFAVAAQTGADVWTTMLPMLGQGLDGSIETLFGTAPADALLAHAMAVVRAGDLGDEWESTGPGITDARTEVRLPVGDEPTEARLDVGRFGVLPVRIEVTADEVLALRIEGGTTAAVELPGLDVTRLAPGGRLLVCLEDGGCVCEDGSPVGGGLPQADPGTGAVAVGGLTADELAVIAEPMTVSEACEQSPLVGEWTTDVSNVMRALAAAYGAMPACTGPWVATFGADGAWTGGYRATCVAGGARSEATARFTGTYTDLGAAFTVADVTGEGSMTIGGVTQPLPGLDGFSSALGGTSEYAIQGDVLRYVVVTPDGERVPISLTRTG